MEYTVDYIKGHQDEFIVKEGSCDVDSNLYFDAIEGYWYELTDNQIKEIKSRIKWVYGIMPYRRLDVIYGLKVTKGFIIKDDNNLFFTSENIINSLYCRRYGHSVELGVELDDRQSDFNDLMKSFRLFSTENEAWAEIKKFMRTNELKAIEIRIMNAKSELDDAQKTYNDLLKEKEAILQKRYD